MLMLSPSKHLPKDLNISFSGRLRLWRKLAALYHNQERLEITQIIDRTARLRDERDWVVHGYWESNSKLVKLHQSHKMRATKRVMSLRKVRKIADEIGELIIDFENFYQQFATKIRTGDYVP